ncbi:MAG TPA: hypothetical protein VFW75_04685 [Acetobacteraceae bacterium]|nr:hypothetical protein [Acetobacteraceae bacterium]
MLALLAGAATAHAAPQHTTRFWNLTGDTVMHLYLAPAGTTKWSADQCRNDPDGSVDFDERLPIKDITTGRYDAKLTERSGRICTVRNVEIKAGAIFTIDKAALTDCTR